MVDPDPQRRRLVRALAAGVFASPVLLAVGCSGAGSGMPVMPPGRNIWRSETRVRVDGTEVDVTARISADALIETSPGGAVVYAVGDTAFLQRGGSRVQLRRDGDDARRVGDIRIESGALLTVFGGRSYRLQTPLAVVGVRGTGVYAAVESGRDYVCTCYGEVDLSARADPASAERIVTTRHDAPRYVTGTGASGSRIQAAPFKDHSDEELLLIETLVGRDVPFEMSDASYERLQREVY